MRSHPQVVLVGGPDVDTRIPLMQILRSEFDFIAVGSSHYLSTGFAQSGFRFFDYSLSRGVNPLADLKTFLALTVLFRKLRPDIVHTFDTKPSVWGRLAARTVGVPIIIGTLPGLGILYTSEARHLIRSIYQPLQRIACKVADLTIFQNHDDSNQLSGMGIVQAHKVRVIPGSGVQTNLYDPTTLTLTEQERVRGELGINPQSVLVTMVSRVIRSKGVLEFAAVAHELLNNYENLNVRFLLVGSVDENNADRLTADELMLVKHALVWPGRRKDIRAILKASDVFVLPSYYREGIPRVLLEAASMGLPIVTTDTPGCREVVEQDINGFLVPPRDPGVLAQAILRLVEEPELRYLFGQESRRRAVDRFELSLIAAQTRSIYLELLAHKGLLPVRET